MARLTLHLLGPPEVRLDGAPVTGFASNKVRALLFYLAVEADRAHSRESLAGLLWPDYPERSARTNLSNALSQLRTTLSDREAKPSTFHISRDAIQFNRESDCWIDVIAFELCMEGEQWKEAIDLYRGRFLEGFSVADSAPFEQWTLVARERAERQLMAALEALIAALEEREDYMGARDAARRQLEIEPWHEGAHRALMRALALSGERASALAQYEDCVQVLKHELDVAPSVETRRLYEQIRGGVLAPKGVRGEGIPPPPAVSAPSRDVLAPLSLQPAAPGTIPVPGVDERRLATVLFLEVAESAALLDDLGHEAWTERMAELYQVVESAVDTYGGEVSERREEGLVALFGVPVAHEDDAERAVLAALAIQESVGRYGKEVACPSVRVGVDTGELLVTYAGEERHVVGRALTLARRAGIAAEPGTALVGENAYRLVRSLFEWADEGAGRGMYRPVARQARLDKGRGIPGLSSPLVGRDEELGLLREAVERVRAGVGGIVTVVGEAGIGKSRLVAEARRWASQGTGHAERGVRDTLWVEGRCLSYAANVAYHLWLDVLHALLGTAPDEPAASVQAALVAQVRARCPARFHEVYPYLCRLLSLSPQPVEGLPAADGYEAARNARGESLRAEVFRAVEALLEGAAGQGALVVVCEDLHWADPTSLALLERLLALAERLPVLYLCVFRPDTAHGCWRIKETAARDYRHRHADLWLDALSTVESEALVGHLLHIEDLPRALRAQILEHAGGNPFYVEEILRALIAEEVIAYDKRTGRWGTTQEIEKVPLPATLQGVLMARIDRLPADAKRTLQVASVIGRSFSYRLLAVLRTPLQGEKKVAGQVKASMLDAHLLVLQREQLIRQRAYVSEREYIFHHVLTREAAYNSLLRRDRCVYHRRVAEALEQLFPARVEERLGLLAYHWEAAEEIQKAVAYLLRAGEQARTAYANEEAVHYYRCALALLDEIDPAQVHHDWWLAGWSGLGKVYFGVGRVIEAVEPLRKAIALGKELKLASDELAVLYHWLGESLNWLDRWEEYRRLAEEGLVLVEGNPESVGAALMNQIAAIAYWSKGRREKLFELTYRTAQFLEHLPYSEELRSAYVHISFVFTQDKDADEARRWLQLLEWESRQHHDLRALGNVHDGVAGLLSQQGDLHGALSRRWQALEVYTDIGDVRQIGQILRAMKDDFLAQGDLLQASEYAERALENAAYVGKPRDMAEGCLYQGWMSLCQGDHDEAIRALTRSDQLYREIGAWWSASEANHLLGRAYLARGERAEALAYFEEALELMASGRISDFLLAFVRILSDCERVIPDVGVFRSFCRRLRKVHPQVNDLPLAQWYLEPAEAFTQDRTLTKDDHFEADLAQEWAWHDPFGDCSYNVQDGLTIHAANGRHLWSLNLSAPRVLRNASGALIVQTACGPLTDAKPSIGGLLLWKDEQNYLHLDRGLFGEREITLAGCIDGEDVFIGRGWLYDQAERVLLRLERVGDQVHAYCSADGKDWYTVGQATFSMHDPIEVGLHAIGNIDRTIYHGAHPEGTAIRFASFQLWEI